MAESKVEQYILDHIDPESEILYELDRVTHLKMVHPRMISGHLQGKTLQMVCRMLQPKKILEIGTFTGYSAICLAQGMHQDGHLHTIELNDEMTDIPLEYFKKAGLDNKITLHVGNALEIIPTIHETFDLVFLDAEKDEYLEYYEAVFDKVRTGGIILADNVLWNGKVLQEESSNDYFTKGIKKFNDFISEDKRVEKVILPVRDGLMVIYKL